MISEAGRKKGEGKQQKLQNLVINITGRERGVSITSSILNGMKRRKNRIRS